MKYSIEHVFDHPLAVVEKAMMHPDLAPFLVERMPSLDQMEPLQRDETDFAIKRRVRYLPKPIIKRIGPKKVPPEAMEWIEVSSYDKATHVLTFDNQPTHPKVKKLFVNQGTITLVERNGRTVRTMDGVLHIKVAILGKVAERMIYKTAAAILKEECEALNAFIAQHL